MTTSDTSGRTKRTLGAPLPRRPFFKLSDFVLEAILLAIIVLLAFSAPGFAFRNGNYTFIASNTKISAFTSQRNRIAQRKRIVIVVFKKSFECNF